MARRACKIHWTRNSWSSRSEPMFHAWRNANPWKKVGWPAATLSTPDFHGDGHWHLSLYGKPLTTTASYSLPRMSAQRAKAAAEKLICKGRRGRR